ncbi:MAG TPA: lysoplasmalogenase [Burkholderiaceae bacterium]|nr:lysoplasmalogenase [Burkholderiaceae bacterium]
MKLLVAAIASALLAMLAGPLQLPWLAFVFKPLTTILILVYAWPRGAGEPLVRRWLLAGLVLSLLGDVALLWPQQGFLPGLIAFLLAHLSYIVAFSRRARFAARWQPFALYAAVALAILSQLWSGLPAALRGPVMAYVLCLAAMAAQAAVAWWVARGSEHEVRLRSAAIGGALFVASDALLATDKFLVPLPAPALWILATYWAAQWCIASSLQALVKLR